MKKRKLESHRQVAPALVSPTKIEEGWKQVRRRCEERGRARARAHLSAASLACEHPLFGRSSFLEATVQRYTAPLNEFLAFEKMSLDELQLLAKLDEMVVDMLEHMNFQGYGHGAGDYLMAAIKFVGWIKISPIFPRRTGAERVPSVSTGYVSGPSPRLRQRQ